MHARIFYPSRALNIVMTMSLIEMAEKISRHVVEELGEQVRLIIVYGSTARGEATPFSDLDILVITADASYQSSFVLQGRPVEIWSMTFEECKKLIITPSLSWGVAVTMFFQNKVLYGDRSILTQLQNLYRSLNMEPFIQFCAKNLVYFAEILGKVKGAAQTKDLVYARWAAYDLANSVAGMVAMINKKYYLNQWGKHMAEILQCKILPEGFEHYYRILWLSSDFDELVATINHLHIEFQRILSELGAEIPHFNSLQEAMNRRQ